MNFFQPAFDGVPLNADLTSPVNASADDRVWPAEPPGVGGADLDGGGDLADRGDEFGVERGDGWWFWRNIFWE